MEVEEGGGEAEKGGVTAEVEEGGGGKGVGTGLGVGPGWRKGLGLYREPEASPGGVSSYP